MDREQRLPDGDERGGICARCSHEVLPQRHHGKEADDTNNDNDGFKNTGGDKAESHAFVLSLEDGEQGDGGADIGDDEDLLEDRAQGHAHAGASTKDKVGVVQHRVVKNKCCNREDEGVIFRAKWP
jgi:hypothetical protein